METRGEAVFAARNAVDGIYENDSHGTWPYQSWGINRDPSAALTIEFGCSVTVDELRLTLRADFPHDSYWTQATVAFDDGSREALQLTKTAAPDLLAGLVTDGMKLFHPGWLIVFPLAVMGSFLPARSSYPRGTF